MNKFPEEFEVTIIVKCGGKTYCQGPHLNVLTNDQPNTDMIIKMFLNSSQFLIAKLVKDLKHNLNKYEE